MVGKRKKVVNFDTTGDSAKGVCARVILLLRDKTACKKIMNAIDLYHSEFLGKRQASLLRSLASNKSKILVTHNRL